MSGTLYFRQILIEPDFSRHTCFFFKSSNIKFHSNRWNVSRSVTCGWTDRHGEVNCRCSQIFWTLLIMGGAVPPFHVCVNDVELTAAQGLSAFYCYRSSGCCSNINEFFFPLRRERLILCYTRSVSLSLFHWHVLSPEKKLPSVGCVVLFG